MAWSGGLAGWPVESKIERGDVTLRRISGGCFRGGGRLDRASQGSNAMQWNPECAKFWVEREGDEREGSWLAGKVRKEAEALVTTSACRSVELVRGKRYFGCCDGRRGRRRTASGEMLCWRAL